MGCIVKKKIKSLYKCYKKKFEESFLKKEVEKWIVWQENK